MRKLMIQGASVLLLTLCAAVVGSLSASWLATPAGRHIEGDYSAQRETAGEAVILIGTDWCGYCKQARAHLTSRGVRFADIDAERSEMGADWLRTLQAPGVPVLLIGDRQLRGFNADSIDEALAAWRRRE